MGYFFDTFSRLLARPRTQVISEYGRVLDRDTYTAGSMDANPDPIDEDSTGNRYFKVANNATVKAGLTFRDISRLFVSAAGLEPDENEAYFPPQLIYTSTQDANQEQFDALAFQYDEQFQGGFAPILRSLHQPALQYGRAIGEISWVNDGGKFYADFIWSRDPEEFIFSPPDRPPGLYKKKHLYSNSFSTDLIRMPAGKFMYISYDPLFNNPYGQSALRPLAKLTERYDIVCDAWNEGLMKAGYGMWLGEYGVSLAGDSSAAVTGRDNFLTQIKKLASGQAGIFDERNKIRNEKLEFQAGAFLDKHTTFVQTVSVLLTGSATALIEGKFGSYAKEESTSVRQKSDFEQADAMLMGLAFTYQFNRFFLHYNFGQVDAVPQLQLIAPERIMPTTPDGQDTQVDIEQEEIAIEQEEDTLPDESEEQAEFAEEMDAEKKTKLFPYLTV